MPGLSVITGAPSALDAALAAEVRRHKADDPLAPITVVTGGTLLRPFLRARLATLLRGHINVRVVTPAEIALRLGEPALIAAGRTPITPLADRALAQEVARRAQSYFEPVRETPGFANALHRLFGELRAACVSAERLAGAATDAKQRELAGLYGGYLEARASFYDAGDAMAAPDPGRLDDRAVLLYGVWEAAPRLRSLLEVIAARVPVTVLLPLTGTVADDAHCELREWLASRGADVRRLDAARPRSALETMRHQLFADAPTAVAADDSVAMISAPDPVREAREAVRACLDWAASGIGFHEMAIAYRHGAQYRGLIDQALREAAVPVYLHEGTPLSERPLGRQAFALLDLFDSNLPRAQVMQFLADARLPDRTWERYGGVSAPSWDGLSRQAGIVEGAAQWRDRLALLHAQLTARAESEEDSPEWLERRIEDVDRLAAFVADLDAAIGRRPLSASWAAQLCYLGELFGTYLQDAEGLVGALATLADLDALGEPVSGERFLDVVRAAIDGLRVGDVSDERQGAFARRGVNVLDVNSLRGLSFRAVAIVGLVERSFPPPPRQDPLLLDDERDELACSAGLALALRARGADAEALQFALAVGAAEERLQLSFARAESAGGRSQLPSRFFRDAARALVGEQVRADRVDELPAWCYRRISATRLIDGDLGGALSLQEYERALVQEQPQVGVALIERSSPTLTRALAAQRARWHSPALTAFDGVLGPAALPALLARVGPDRPLSPTALESYATCPYRFFLEKVLGLKELDEPEAVDRIDALARGSLLHRILQRFLEQLGDRRPSAATRDGDQRRLREIALEECEAVEQRGLTGGGGCVGGWGRGRCWDGGAGMVVLGGWCVGWEGGCRSSGQKRGLRRR